MLKAMSGLFGRILRALKRATSLRGESYHACSVLSFVAFFSTGTMHDTSGEYMRPLDIKADRTQNAAEFGKNVPVFIFRNNLQTKSFQNLCYL